MEIVIEPVVSYVLWFSPPLLTYGKSPIGLKTDGWIPYQSIDSWIRFSQRQHSYNIDRDLVHFCLLSYGDSPTGSNTGMDEFTINTIVVIDDWIELKIFW